MALSVRKRGQVWHARGTVRVGSQVFDVAEFSTGARSRVDAEAVAAHREAEIRAEALEGAAGKARHVTIAECLLAYLERPAGVNGYDRRRVAELNDLIGHYTLSNAEAAWQHWLATRGAKLSAGSVIRWRGTLGSALAHGAARHGAVAPRLPPVHQPEAERAIYLTDAELARLLAAYNPLAAPLALTLAYQGMRTQEAMRMDWREVDWRRRTLYIPTTKTGRARTVPMHRRVRVALYLIWRRRNRPASGPVFLTHRGTPYHDTRGKGGQPMKRAHQAACRRAGVTCRVHDLRHTWAARMVMSGCDLYTLMRLGGWSSLRMVQRYSAVSAEHMAEAMWRLR